MLATLLLMTSLPAAAADISQLNWLSGCWAYDDQDIGSGERWTAPIGGMMFAVSRTIRDGKTVAFEYLYIVETDAHALQLMAAPSGQAATRFDMVSLTKIEVIFENAKHDFPQRIIYRLGDNGTLLGRIEGQSDGRKVTVDFPMTRTDCGDLGL